VRHQNCSSTLTFALAVAVLARAEPAPVYCFGNPLNASASAPFDSAPQSWTTPRNIPFAKPSETGAWWPTCAPAASRTKKVAPTATYTTESSAAGCLAAGASVTGVQIHVA
jgi:hypothetical protein